MQQPLAPSLKQSHGAWSHNKRKDEDVIFRALKLYIIYASIDPKKNFKAKKNVFNILTCVFVYNIEGEEVFSKKGSENFQAFTGSKFMWHLLKN